MPALITPPCVFFDSPLHLLRTVTRCRYKSQGKFEEAEPLFTEAIRAMRVTLPDDHSDIAKRCVGEFNRDTAAHTMVTRETRIPREIEMTEARRRMNTLPPHSKTLPRSNRLRFVHSNPPPSHFHAHFARLLYSLINLAKLYAKMGREGRAEELFLESLTMMVRTRGRRVHVEGIDSCFCVVYCSEQQSGRYCQT